MYLIKNILYQKFNKMNRKIIDLSNQSFIINKFLLLSTVEEVKEFINFWEDCFMLPLCFSKNY